MVYKRRASHQVSEIIPDDQEAMGGREDYAYAGKGGGGFLKVVVTILVIVIVLLGAWYLLDNYTNLNLPGLSSSNQNMSKGWYAIFLSNGQVYFGKIDKINDRELVLSNIYYLQVVTKPLQQSQETVPPAAAAQNQQELTLAKLGNELHGPRDVMNINRDHILLTEELKEDSKVVTAITTYINEQAAQK